MCGRYLIPTEGEIIEFREIINEINERYKDTALLAAMASGEVYPTYVAPILVRDKDKPRAALMQWGFPKWQGKGVIINARAETVPGKKMFSKPLLRSRCVVPTAGFFEWRLEEDNKKNVKYLFCPPKGNVLYLAGLYDKFASVNTAHDAYVILTTAANPSVASYHDRMPLVLDSDKVDEWLSDTAFALEFVQKPCESLFRSIHPASNSNGSVCQLRNINGNLVDE